MMLDDLWDGYKYNKGMDFLRMTSYDDKRYKSRRNTSSGMSNLFKTAIGTAFANFLS